PRLHRERGRARSVDRNQAGRRKPDAAQPNYATAARRRPCRSAWTESRARRLRKPSMCLQLLRLLEPLARAGHHAIQADQVVLLARLALAAGRANARPAGDSEDMDMLLAGAGGGACLELSRIVPMVKETQNSQYSISLRLRSRVMLH